MSSPDRLDVAVLNEWGAIPSFYVRVAEPLDATSLSWRAFPKVDAPEDVDVVLRTPVILVQRCMGAAFLDVARRAKARGARIIYEIDDQMLALPQRSLFVMEPAQKENIRAFLSMADVVTVSTATLKREFSSYATDIRVLLNYGVAKPRVAMTGGPHLCLVNTDYFKLRSAGAFFSALDSAVVGLGYRVSFFGSVDPGMEALRARRPQAVTIVSSFQPDRSAFLDRLARSGVNVGVVPLDRDPDHVFKSDIKFTDFASLGIPAVYNNPEVYAHVRHEVDGYMCADTHAGWMDGFRFFAQAQTRAACGRLAREVMLGQRSLQGYVDGLLEALGIVEGVSRMGGTAA